MHPLAKLDHEFIWHPFTQMRDWLKQEPIVITHGKGAVLRDAHGRKYLDANSSIWTNLHGHNHPKINAAIKAQLKKIAHSSALGLANEPASLLAQQLVKLAWRPSATGLSKVFFSDNGSTAVEVALKLAYEYARRVKGIKKPRFLSLQGAYHGDTVGAVSLGHIDLFHKSYRGLLFETDAVMAPYCYRCPFNRARPERADARDYRKCNWECVDKVEQQFAANKREPYAGIVIEPRIQGAAGMIPQPNGWLRSVDAIAHGHGTQLIFDEVMTGFCRTLPMFAFEEQEVFPDFLCLAKGLTGGYLPMAATLTHEGVFNAFLGDYSELKTFFHGHSYTANQLGSAAALASIDLLLDPRAADARASLSGRLDHELKALWQLPNVGDIRQVGLIAGIELVKNWKTREPFDLRDRAGIRVCEAMARRGVLTRPIGNVIVLMPPYCTTPKQVHKMVSVLAKAIKETLPG
jgi:adenosylmethionine-8-amino-7-oxononanoate aminotransferase